MKNILFTSSGRRVQLITEFRNAMEKVDTSGKIVTVDASNLAATSRFSHAHYLVPSFHCTDEYIHSLIEICQKEQVGLLIPLHEGELLTLLKARNRFEAIGTRILLSDQQVIEICKDKYETYLFFKQHNIPTPLSFTRNHITDIQDSHFPLIVKPRQGMGSNLVFKAESRSQLDFFAGYVPDPIIQTCAQGEEYTMDVFNDFDGNPLVVVPRLRMEVRSGEVSKSKVVKHEPLIQEISRILQHIKIIGPANIQAIVNDKEIVVIEINPRFGGGVPLSMASGIDYARYLIRTVRGDACSDFSWKYRDGAIMVRYDEALYF